MERDEFYMREAIKEAKKAFEEGEVPIGAIIVRRGRIIGRGHNRVESLNDPTAHAEIIAITAATQFLKNWRLNECTMYVTVEPCIMCSGAIVLSRLKEVVYALPDPKFGGCESLYRIPEDSRLNHKVIVRRGPFEDEVRSLMREFFEMRRS